MNTQRDHNPQDNFPDHPTDDACDYDHEAYLEAHKQRMAAKQAQEEAVRTFDRDRLTIAAAALKARTNSMAREARTCVKVLTEFAEDQERPKEARDNALKAAEKLRQAQDLIKEATPLLEPARKVYRQLLEG